jgi:hypothetical protein
MNSEDFQVQPRPKYEFMNVFEFAEDNSEISRSSVMGCESWMGTSQEVTEGGSREETNRELEDALEYLKSHQKREKL